MARALYTLSTATGCFFAACRFIFPIFVSEYFFGYISLCLNQGLNRFLKCVFSDYYEYIDVKIEELLCFPFPILKSIFTIPILSVVIVNENDVKQAPGSKSHVG